MEKTLITKTQQQIVEENIPLVGYIAKKFKPRNRHEYDDLVQQGTIALIDAVRKFDKTRAKLSTLIHICVYREIHRYLEKNNKVVLKRERDNNSYYGENAVSEYFGENLTDVEKKVVELRTQGLTYREIEEECGKNRNWAGKILKRALAKIKETI